MHTHLNDAGSFGPEREPAAGMSVDHCPRIHCGSQRQRGQQLGTGADADADHLGQACKATHIPERILALRHSLWVDTLRHHANRAIAPSGQPRLV